MAPLQIDADLLDRKPDAIWSVFREVKTRLALLPPLQDTLRQADGALAAGLHERASLLGIATLHPESLLLLRRLFQQEGLDMASSLFLQDEATITAHAKQLLLPQGVHVQKTVSLLLGGHLLLVTSIGDHHLEREERFVIAAKLGLSRKEARQATLNPPGFQAEQLGLLRGMVSPFLPPGRGAELAALVQLAWPTSWEHADQRVAISLSPYESLLIPLSSYGRILASY